MTVLLFLILGFIALDSVRFRLVALGMSEDWAAGLALCGAYLAVVLAGAVQS